MTRQARHQYHQTRLPESITGKTFIPNIEAVGDPLLEKEEGILRLAFQNVHGVSGLRGLEVPSEIEAMEDLEIDIMGMAETNVVWTSEQKLRYDSYLSLRFRSAQTVYSAAPALSHRVSHQPGGTLLTLTGAVTSRICDRGSDKLGRFSWVTLRGQRSEGILLVMAYRVCQTRSSRAGPTTAYSQQFVELRKTGDRDPHPRKQVLADIERLIRGKRDQGYRPIVMIDANGDYIGGKDTDLGDFLLRTSLSDPFYERFQITPRTYLYGSSRIDYIFADPALISAISRVGYLGSHEGAPSDHVMAYVDLHEKRAFAGILNRPPPFHSREILIEQEDKVQAFLRTLRPLLESHKMASRTFDLAKLMVERGATADTIRSYTKLYGEFLELVRGAAKQAGKKKYGYTRSPALITAGRHTLAARFLLDCKRRGTTPTKKLLNLGKLLSLDIEALLEQSELQLRRQLREARTRLFECQKTCESLRAEWLQTVAQERAAAAGDQDWERLLQQ
jgi:hypothetical protein